MARVPVGRPGMRALPDRADLPGKPRAQRGDMCSLPGLVPGVAGSGRRRERPARQLCREGAGQRFRGAPERTAQVTHTGGMGDSPADGAGAGEVFDHELTRVLHEHGQVLEEHSRALLTAGAASVTVPGVMLHARLRIPRRWRKGLLEVTSEDPASGEVLGSSSRTLARAGSSRGSLSLIEEITTHLALEVVYGPSAQMKRGGG